MLPAVICIWGLIIYRICSGSASDNDLQSAGESAIHEFAPLDRDTFSLLGSYRDPFQYSEPRPQFQGSDHTAGKTIVATKEKKQVAKPAVNAVAWPSVGYSGVIKNQKSQKELAMVQIDGQPNLMISGDIIANVQLVKVFRDSIHVKYGKERKTIKK